MRTSILYLNMTWMFQHVCYNIEFCSYSNYHYLHGILIQFESTVFSLGRLFNSLWPGDAIRRHRSGSTLAQVMACCLTAPSHYLNQCWLSISSVQWLSSKDNLTRDTSAINHYNQLENYLSKIQLRSPRGQWVKLHFNTSVTKHIVPPFP